MSERHVSVCCQGERCSCGKPAEHKVEETMFDDDPTAWIEMEVNGAIRRIPARHPLTAYVCHEHFVLIMGITEPAGDPEAAK